MAFDTLQNIVSAFAPLPNQMFALRELPQWNVPVYMLATEAAPRALNNSDLIDGPKRRTAPVPAASSPIRS